ncbi:MFS transporter [Spirosoma areae]
MNGKFRWTVVGLLFLATTINYIDRQIISLLKPMLEKDFNWSESDYGTIVVWFQVAYALGYLLAGRFVDSVGAKLGYGLSVLFWSMVAMGHALARSTLGFSVARGLLGFTEAGNFPAAMKAIAEWFPASERSTATGIMLAGTTVGPIMAPALVPWLAVTYGWQTAFVVTGAIGLAWLVLWYWFYEKPERQTRLQPAERVYINEGRQEALVGDAPEEKVPYRVLLTKKATWSFLLAKLLTDPIWWFYLFWLPSYLTSHGMSMTEIALPIMLVYSITAALSVVGGMLGAYFLRIGWSVAKGRNATLLICMLFALPIMLIRYSDNSWLSVVIIALAASAQTVWMGTLLTKVTDQFPRQAVSSVIGIGGMAGALGGILFAKAVGSLLDVYKSNHNLEGGYNLLFVVCGLAYIVSFLIIQLLSPNPKKPEAMGVPG